MHKHLKRLARIWSKEPIFFITTATYQRRPILANPAAAGILIDEWRGALDRHGWMVGRYVIMPDHVHFFCAPTGISDPGYKSFSAFMQQWKQWTSKRIIRECSRDGCSRDGPSRLQMQVRMQATIWQAEFFDHLLRTEESYNQKWMYVMHNPVRAGLVKSPENWIWQGEINPL